jgi:hypothetical protein
LQQQTSAINRLNALSGEVMNMHSIEGNTPQQLQDLRAQTEPIKGIVQQLEHDAARSPSLVFHSEHLNALAVRAQLDNLVALLNEKQEDATARLMLAAQVTTIAENKTMLQDALKSAAAIEKDENATLESVNFALEILEKDGRPHLSVIEQTYSQLTSAPEADAVRAQALSDMTNLGENLKTLQLQLDDRYAGMRAFDEKCGALENLLTETEILTSADLQERSQLEKAQLALDSIRPLMAQIEVDAVELQPMRMPTQKVADFQARQARLGVKMQVLLSKLLSNAC